METTKDMNGLIELVKQAREAKGLSIRKLADIAGLHHSFLSKLEAGAYEHVSAESLMALASALELPPADLFSLAGYRLPESLPSFGPYLRTRYGQELSPADLSALTHLFDALRARGDGADEVDDEAGDHQAVARGDSR
jgi:transcriptional regulator with XRE-family HTH domain